LPVTWKGGVGGGRRSAADSLAVDGRARSRDDQDGYPIGCAGDEAVNNDSTNFDAIYRDYYPRIQRYLARLIGFDEAEDVAQEVFLKVSRSLDDFRGESSMLTWVYRIATNAAMDRTRTPAYRARLTSVPLNESCETGDGAVPIEDRRSPVEDQAIRSEMSGCVQGFMAQLPDQYRTVLVLSETEGMKNSEIAEVVGVSIETVKIRLHRARTRLKALLEAHCSFYRDPCNTLLCDIKTPPHN
jgi:RNA polymerase sigma-70 factor (ECF subfamily)